MIDKIELKEEDLEKASGGDHCGYTHFNDGITLGDYARINNYECPYDHSKLEPFDVTIMSGISLITSYQCYYCTDYQHHTYAYNPFTDKWRILRGADFFLHNHLDKLGL